MSDGFQCYGEDWDVIRSMLPANWEEKARELGAHLRSRNFRNANDLLRVMLIHLIDGCSLRETAVRAAQGGLANVSDVALLKRLRFCDEWFRWISVELMRLYVSRCPDDIFPDFRVRLIDASTVCEPGATGSTWRIHYSFVLGSLQCDEAHITVPKIGESFKRFSVSPGDLLVGDRGYAHREGISHVVAHGGHALVRLNLSTVPLEDAGGNALVILDRLRQLEGHHIGEWSAWVSCEERKIPVRLCAIRKSEEATRHAMKKVKEDARRKGRTVLPETLEAAGYIFVVTTLPHSISADAVLEVYRGRWQIELAFKRLKSLLDLGHLKKTDIQGGKAWLQGKLMAALLIEALIAAGESFFPWGFPIKPLGPSDTVPMA
jgi:hypothetical protein